MLVFAACGKNTTPLTGALSQTPGGPGSVVPSLQDVTRLSAAASDHFYLQQRGAEFAHDLPTSSCVGDGNNADFAPSWSDSGPNLLSNAAFGIYRLSYDPAAAPITLSLSWSSAPGDGDCWIGLSDWESGAWSWQVLPASQEIEVANPERFVDAAQHCYAVVLLLGQNPASLSTIGFGTPVPTGDGYTLVAPLSAKDTYLLDMDGNVVNTWSSGYFAGASAVLLENGNLLRGANLGNPSFNSGGTAGRLEEFDWQGNLVWFYELSTTTQCTHHDFCKLPNGNILLIVWNYIPDAEIIDAGRDPSTINSGLFWADSIIEIERTFPSGGNIVWEWKVTDHLIQDFDATKLNFGDPGTHPELVDVNFPQRNAGDWTHLNCVSYNADLDQIAVTTPILSELWVIDHSTTTAEAAGHTGGQYGHGGDLLYRWGNPQAYRQGTDADEQLFGGHDVHWIANGLPGAGDLIVFNNQVPSNPPGDFYSSIVQITTPRNPDGSYYMTGSTFGPAAPTWQYAATAPETFHSAFMGSSQRLPNGDTLICEAANGFIFVVDPAGVRKWSYQYDKSPGVSVFRARRYPLDYPGVDNLP
jgi:hypothetical protein